MNHYHAPHIAGMHETTKRSPRKGGRDSDHWMQGAVKPSHKGLFTKKAERAGMSVSAYAKKEAGAKGTLGKEARLAEVFERSAHHRKGK